MRSATPADATLEKVVDLSMSQGDFPPDGAVLTYTADAAVPMGKSAIIASWDTATGEWIPLKTELSAARTMMSANLAHFSTYGFFEIAGNVAGLLADVRTSPPECPGQPPQWDDNSNQYFDNINGPVLWCVGTDPGNGDNLEIHLKVNRASAAEVRTAIRPSWTWSDLWQKIVPETWAATASNPNAIRSAVSKDSYFIQPGGEYAFRFNKPELLNFWHATRNQALIEVGTTPTDVITGLMYQAVSQAGGNGGLPWVTAATSVTQCASDLSSIGTHSPVAEGLGKLAACVAGQPELVAHTAAGIWVRLNPKDSLLAIQHDVAAGTKQILFAARAYAIMKAAATVSDYASDFLLDPIAREFIFQPSDKALKEYVTGKSAPARFVDVVTAEYSSTVYALKDDGTLWAWGNNRYGQLGIGTALPSSRPVQVKNLTGVKSIATDGSATFAVERDGTLWAWGNGRLGVAGSSDAELPVQVHSLAGVQNVTLGVDSAYALTSDGTVWAWGSNHSGQLGNGSTTDSSTPVQVQNLSGVQSIATSVEAVYALKTDGTVWSWGSNRFGDRGNGTASDMSSPSKIPGLESIRQIAASRYAAFAVRNDGTVWAWGDNSLELLGNGTTTSLKAPGEVERVSGAQGITTDGYSAFALKSDGTVWSWGLDHEGQLGIGTGPRSASPTQAVGPTGIRAIVTAGYSTYAVGRDGSLWVWGINDTGLLGTVKSSFLPLRVPSLSGVQQVASQGASAFALKADGTLWAWGQNRIGELGNGTTAASATPVQVR